MASLPDGGYVVAGQTRSWGAGDWDAYVLRLDAVGDSVWTRVFGGPGVDRALNIAVTPAGSIAVTGFTTATPDADLDGFVTLLDPDGHILWNRTLHGERNEVGHGIVVDNAGNLLVTGYGNSWGAGGNDVDLWGVGPHRRYRSRPACSSSPGRRSRCFCSRGRRRRRCHDRGGGSGPGRSARRVPGSHRAPRGRA